MIFNVVPLPMLTVGVQLSRLSINEGDALQEMFEEL
jgi:hypothetical protein